jgi:hypothetical protein
VRGEAGGKVMRENEPVLLVLSVYDGEIILEKGEMLSEKRHLSGLFCLLCHRQPDPIAHRSVLDM